MAVIWPTPVYPNPYIQLDHPHPRTQHWNHLAALLPHAFGAAHTHPFTPDVDVRESATAFYIAVELPGLRDPKAVKLVWHNNRTLHAFGKTEYSFEGEKLQDATEEGEAERKKKAEELAEEDAKKNGVNGYDGGPLTRTLRHVMHAMHDREATELFATHERKTGPFERTVLFPVEMEMKELKASIEAGLLKIVVPKLVEELHRGGSAHVSFVE